MLKDTEAEAPDIEIPARTPRRKLGVGIAANRVDHPLLLRGFDPRTCAEVEASRDMTNRKPKLV